MAEPRKGPLAATADNLRIDEPVPGGVRGAAPGGGRSGDPGFRARMEGVLSQMGTPEEVDTSLTDAERKRQWLNLGLNLMRAGGDWRNNLFSAAGQAGAATLQNVDKLKQQKRKQGLRQQQAQQAHLGRVLDYLSGQQEFEAGREDEQFDRKETGAKIDLRRDKADSLDRYRKGRLAEDRRVDPLDQARIDATRALEDKRRAAAASEGASGGLDAGQVRLRNGQVMSADDVRQLYRERYGEWDPQANQFSFGPDAPPVDEFFDQTVTPDTNPFRTGRMSQPDSYLDQIENATRRRREQPGGPHDVPVPLRGGNDYSDLWR